LWCVGWGLILPMQVIKLVGWIGVVVGVLVDRYFQQVSPFSAVLVTAFGAANSFLKNFGFRGLDFERFFNMLFVSVGVGRGV